MDERMAVVILRRRERRRSRPKGPGYWMLRLLLALVLLSLLTFVGTAAAGVAAAAGIYAYYAQGLPDPRAIEKVQEDFETTKIYDRTGTVLLYEVFDPRPNRGDRTWVELAQIPLDLRNATIAIEDRSFYQNPGVNLRGIARAFWSNLRGLPVQGGSSITMQLIKNVLIPSEERYVRSYERKIKEAILALELSRRYPGREGKDQILEWYLNTNFYGNFAYGVEAAAQVYFDKHVWELDLAECAMLAAIPQYPGLNPIDAPEQAKKRQALVLDQMVEQGYITREQAEAAKAQPLKIRESLETRFQAEYAPHFAIYVRKLLEQEFGHEKVYGGGLRVYTTLDVDIQRMAEQAAREHIKSLQEDPKVERNVSNAAVVVLRPRTGEILAMVGSLDYNNKEIDGQVNMAIAPRQPGSAFKPFTYLTAFAQGYTPATMVMDVRTSFPNPPGLPYTPENYDRKYHGPLRLRQALACSYNIPAVWLLSKVGVMNTVRTAHRMGINTLNEDYYGLSLTLGGGEVTLLDMTFAFSVLANGGVMIGEPVPPERQRPGYRQLDPVAILRVEDRNGNVLKEYVTPSTQEVVSPQLAYLLNDILSDNAARIPAFGVNNKMHLEDRPAAIKTGTTDDWRDAWAIGYTPQYAVGVWAGNADNEPMNRVPGSLGAAPIWQRVMEELHKGLPVEPFVRPPGIEEKRVCAISGLLPTENCPNTVKEIFIQGTAPTVHCNVHQKFRVNKETGRLATVYTPPELVEERVYEIYPPEAADWVRENNIPQPPTLYDDAYGPGPVNEEVGILEPRPYQYISKGVIVRGNARGPDFRLWRLEFGEGMNPSAWSQIGTDHYDQRYQADLDYWDVSGLAAGLYTLQLRVVQNSGNVRDAAIQVYVDNTPPKAKVIHPDDGDLYLMEDDEWVNIQVDAMDNVYLDRVEFYLDGVRIGESTISPFSYRWTIAMSDTIPIPGFAITRTEQVLDEFGQMVERVITETEVLTSTFVVDGREVIRYTQVFSGGRAIISDTLGYTETHVVYAVAYDAAGNSVETEKVRFYVMHKPKEKEKPTAWWPSGGEVAWVGGWARPARGREVGT